MAARHAKRPRAELAHGILPQLLGYRLRLAQQAVFRDFAASVGQVSPGRAGIVLLIEANPGVTQGRLAEAVRLDRSTMVGVIDSLEERGLVERRRGSDRRTNGLWLTRPGRLLALRLRQRIARHERRVAARLSDAERAQLLALLAKLAQ
ncbi:MAG TPA: MarR family transcriptional regulator [Burkholderiales bacterium]|nr:MarR family transcriptional regulator [Burkholderiales bacterium]